MIERILLADDSIAIKKAIKMAFNPKKVTIVESASYCETMDQCERFQPQLIIADSQLAGANTPHDFKVLKDRAKGADLVLIESSIEPIDKQQFKELSRVGFIKKPFNYQQLNKVLTSDMALTFNGGFNTFSDKPAPPPPPQASLEANLKTMSGSESKPRQENSSNISEMPNHSFGNLSQNDLRAWIKECVQEFCREEFKNVAKSVLEQEINELRKTLDQ